MADTPRLTPLRLAMLRKVRAGEVYRGYAPWHFAYSGPLPSKTGFCWHAVCWLLDHNLCRKGDPFTLTDKGRAALEAS